MNTIKVSNPFIIGHYESPEYFCDREEEVNMLIKHIENGRNVTLSSPRRLGKTGLICHLFAQDNIKEKYYTFFIDLYATSSLAEFVALMGKVIYEDLRKREDNWKDRFVNFLSSLRPGLKIDTMTGSMGFDIGLGEITSPQVTLDEIFEYLENADRHCIVAIDEFQQITQYKEKNIEALLRTKIQHCRNVSFVFTGSKRHLMTQMFHTQSKPFYQSTTGMNLDVIAKPKYIDFAERLFTIYGKTVDAEAVSMVYDRFYGYTWYIQMVMNELFYMTDKGGKCETGMVDVAVENILRSQEEYYKSALSNCGMKQREVLIAIAREETMTRGWAKGVTTKEFIKRYSLPSASSVQAAIKGLEEKDYVTAENGMCHIDDLFMAEYLAKK